MSTSRVETFWPPCKSELRFLLSLIVNYYAIVYFLVGSSVGRYVGSSVGVAVGLVGLAGCGSGRFSAHCSVEESERCMLYRWLVSDLE